MFKVCLDIGHGGKDPGAIGPTGLKEKDVTLAIGLELEAELSRHGVAVTMTRDTDREVNPKARDQTEELQARCDIANKANADLFVSIHCNSYGGPAISGTETWIWAVGGKAEQLAKAVHPEVVKAQGTIDRGIKEKAYYVLRNTGMPAILVENLFISNPAEEKILRNPAYQRMTAQAMAKGILSFLGARYVPLNPPAGEVSIDDLRGENAQLRNENSQLGLQLQQAITDNNALKGRLQRINGISDLMGV